MLARGVLPGLLLSASLCIGAGCGAGSVSAGTAPLKSPEAAGPARAVEPPRPESPPPPLSPPRNAILISWDGFDRSALRELLDGGRLPNLAALIGEGSLQDISVKGHPTCTKPGHAEMLTGLGTKATGVFSNTDYRPIPEGCTIFERLQDRFGRENIRTFMVTSKIAHVGGRGPEEIKAHEAKPRKKPARKGAGAETLPPGADDELGTEKNEGEPFYLARRRLDLFDSDQRDASVTGPLCLAYLERFKSPRFMAFLHFSDPDHKGHAHGSGGAEYRAAAVACDEWLGKIVGWLKRERLYDSTLVYVTTDHGFDRNATTHKNAPDSWLATNDKAVIRGGIIADVAATILERFGVEIGKLEPKLIGEPLTRPAVAPGAPAPEERPLAPAKRPAQRLRRPQTRISVPGRLF